VPDSSPQFDPLAGSSGEVQRTRLDNNAKIAGFFFLAIGWIARSGSARKFLGSEAPTRAIARAAIADVFFLTAFLSIKAHRPSPRTCKPLLELNDFPSECQETRRGDAATIGTYLIGHGFVALLLVVALLRLAP